MKKLLKNKKGFTLMEMLIVVAIIVILVAISVPTFTANLDEAKKATDAANLRAAKSAAQIYAINNSGSLTGNFYYNVDAGEVQTEPTGGVTGYGECTNHGGENAKYIKVTFDSTGKPTVVWSDNSTGCN